MDLDMQQWKDSQTYQAEVPLANDQVKLQSASMVVKRRWVLLVGTSSKK